MNLLFIGDVFQNYCGNDDLINVARFAFAFTVLFAYPIECMTARSVITQLLGPIDNVLSPNEHVCVTLALVVSTYLISVTTGCLGVVLELNVSYSYSYSFFIKNKNIENFIRFK